MADDPSTETTSPKRTGATTIRFWKRVRWATRVGAALAVALAVFLVARVDGAETAPVLPDTETQFSLDMRVVGSAEVDVVFAVEQRSRPAYRIFAFNPRTGEDTTVFTVPADAIIYGIALSPDRSQLAVAYSPDFNVEGNGIWMLDLDSLDFALVTAVEPGVYLTELEFAADGQSIFATHVDRRAEGEVLSIAAVSISNGRTEVVLERAITPAVYGDDLFYLTVDDEKARRSIGRIAANGTISTIQVDDSTHDLDHLLTDATGALRVAVLEASEESAIALGEQADAHGNHNINSAWWFIEPDGPTPTGDIGVEPIIVYDAVTTEGGEIVYATIEGLALATNERYELIASRAIRFVAG